MPQPDQPASLLSLEPAIDPRPLTVSPDTQLLEVIAMMSKAKNSCVLSSLGLSLDRVLANEARASTILVTREGQLLGVFTSREAVRAIASGVDLAALKLADVMSKPAIALAQSDARDIFDALSLLRQHQIHYLPIVGDGERLVGLVTLASIRRALQLDELLKSRQVGEVISTPILRAPLTTSAMSLARLMAERGSDRILLVATNGRDEQPIGIISERDIIHLRVLELDLLQVQAQTVMMTPLSFLSPSESVLAACWQMQQQRVQEFVVSERPGELSGIVTPISFLQTLELTAMRRAAEQLQRSIVQFEVEKVEPLPDSNAVLQPEVLENPAELLEQLQCSRILTAMALRIRESLELDEILQTAVDEVRQFLQTDRAIVYRFHSNLSGTVVVESVAAGWQSALNNTIQDNCFGKDYAQSYKEGRIQVTQDIYTAGFTQCHIDILVLFDIRACLVVPILQGEHLWGLLCAYHCSAPRRWRPFEIDLLKQLATHVAIAIQQSELYQQVQTELAERKRTEEQLKISLREKEILLKEVHHRVKNNLQIISSLLRLQSDYIEDEKALASFNDSQNRIRSMALLHEKLYQSKDLFRIDFAEYVRDLTDNLLRSYSASIQAIALRTHASKIWLTIDTAIPCGLIINELVSNSLKHAFPTANSENRISIDIHASDENQFTLVISDNGIGFPQDIDFQDTESLGLQLVCTFVEQLEGTIELDRSSGTTFIIKFTDSGTTRRPEEHGDGKNFSG